MGKVITIHDTDDVFLEAANREDDLFRQDMQGLLRLT